MARRSSAPKSLYGQRFPLVHLAKSVVSGFALRCVLFLRAFLRHGVQDRLAPPELVVTEQLTGFWRSAALMAAAELQIADHIGDGACSLDHLARRCGATHDALLRLLRALASIGFFAEDTQGGWRNTRLSRALKRFNAGQAALGPAAVFQFKVQWRHWQRLTDVVRTGQTAPSINLESREPSPLVPGTTTLFDWLSRYPEEQEMFHKAMESVTSLAMPALRSAFPWSQFRSVIDLGGGNGQFLSELSVESHCKRTVLDCEHARPTRLPSGVDFVVGDFFDLDGKLVSYDLLILKHILHDWRDEDCLRILKQISNNMEKHASVVIIETVRDRNGHDLIGVFADLEMMQAFGSRERSVPEFEALLQGSGLSLVRVVHTLSPFKILVACRAGEP